jgi:hypothetical protein
MTMSEVTIPYCTGIRTLPDHLMFKAAALATHANPANSALVVPSVFAMLPVPPTPLQIAVLTSKRWPASGVHLTVGFLESIDAGTRDRILTCANMWSKWANVGFAYTGNVNDADVRIAAGNDGYWSFLGTDIKMVNRGEATMNLQGYLRGLPDSEYVRVVTHEHGHTLGSPHSQARKWIIDRLDPEATIRYYMQTQGWPRQMVIEQVLTPIPESQLIGTDTEASDEISIMCYPFPSQCVRDGREIPGGDHITDEDGMLMGKIYPRQDGTQPPPSTDDLSEVAARLLEIL